MLSFNMRALSNFRCFRVLPIRAHSTLRKNNTVIAAASPSDLFVLDFDGVLVDSEAEVSLAGIRAAQAIWPDAFTQFDLARLKQEMRQTRPVVVVGYETAVMARLLATGTTAEQILADWPRLLAASMSAWEVSQQDLEPTFEKLRNAWMAEQEAEYLSVHTVYPGVKAALRSCEFPFYIATSKKGHRVAKVMSEVVGIPLEQDSPRLFAGLLPPNEAKAAALRTISERPIAKDTGARRHFVDDRLETLKALRQQADLGEWNLYMADWGYNCAEERAEAAQLPGIRLITLKQFAELMTWGVVMGVDDGCEPEAHEIQAGISKTLPSQL